VTIFAMFQLRADGNVEFHTEGLPGYVSLTAAEARGMRDNLNVVLCEASDVRSELAALERIVLKEAKEFVANTKLEIEAAERCYDYTEDFTEGLKKWAHFRTANNQARDNRLKLIEAVNAWEEASRT
jgi:hypothetical protein